MRKSKNSLGVPMGSHQYWRLPKDQKVVARGLSRYPKFNAQAHGYLPPSLPARRASEQILDPFWRCLGEHQVYV